MFGDCVETVTLRVALSSSLTPQLVSCSVSSYQHSSVSLEFFETVVRYDKFFVVEPQHIPSVLVSGVSAGVNV